MYNKWWKHERTRPECDSYNENGSNSLGLSKLGGIFLIVEIVLALALFIAIVEFCWKANQTARNKVFKFIVGFLDKYIIS